MPQPRRIPNLELDITDRLIIRVDTNLELFFRNVSKLQQVFDNFLVYLHDVTTRRRAHQPGTNVAVGGGHLSYLSAKFSR